MSSSLLPLRLDWSKAQDLWASIINPIIQTPANNSIILSNLSLASGKNVINHKLGRKLAGWNPVRVRASATFYDAQDSNQTPALTLILYASANVVVDLEVF